MTQRNKRIILLMVITLLIGGILYQYKEIKEVKIEAMDKYKSNIQFLELTTDIMLKTIKNGNYSREDLIGFSSRCTDSLMISYNLGIPAENIYNTLQKDFLELANRTNRQEDEEIKLLKEIIFNLTTLEEIYDLIDEAMVGSIHEQFDAMTSMELRGQISKYLVEASKNYYDQE